MNGMITIRAQAEEKGIEANFEFLKKRREAREEIWTRDLPAHQFPGKREDAAQSAQPISAKSAETRVVGQPGAAENAAVEPRPLSALEERAEELERERRAYRGRTVAMLRRYLRYSLETGRVPSIMGSEFFRTRVTSYQVTTFEDRMIFVHDMERCIQRLDDFTQRLLARVVLQEYEHEEAARLLGCTRKTVYRKMIEGLDALSDILVKVGLLDEIFSMREKSCQEGETSSFLISDCEESE